MEGATLDNLKERFRTWMNDDKIVRLDLIFGLRGWGLVLYGALPANLALLGVLEIKLANLDRLTSFLVPVVFLPLLTTFLLIRHRQREWYLTTKLLTTRSLIVTAIIFLLSTLISGVSGIIQGKYVVSWGFFGTRSHLITIAESFIIALGSLVLTSTLFLTLLTRESNLPGLPSVDYVKLLAQVRSDLKQLQQSGVWTGAAGLNGDIAERAETIDKNLATLLSYSHQGLANRSLARVRDSIKSFRRSIERISNGANEQSRNISWARSFGAAMAAPGSNGTEAMQPAAAQLDASNIRLLKELPLG